MNSELLQLLGYNNPAVITHFCHHYPEFSLQEGEELFKDLLAWMWLNQQRGKEGKATYLFGPLLILDEMWHSFILHTQEYIDFSTRYFGEYFHHEVEPVGFEHILDEDELTEYLMDCFKYLNQEWVERRFALVFEE